jgi:hypothetical protein
MHQNDKLVRIISMDIEDKYEKLFGYANLVEPPKGLEEQIFNFIGKEEKRLAKIRTWAFGGGTAVSFGFSLWAVIYLIKDFNQTGFWQYFSLIFSENGVMLTYWRELSFSLAESLPITSLIIFLIAIAFLIWSSANVLRKEKFIMNFN